MPKLSPDQRLDLVEKDIVDIKQNQLDVTEVKHSLDNLNDSIKNGHFCKWNVDMGQLIEFKVNTKDYREGLNRRMDKQDKIQLKQDETLTSLVSGKKVMNDIKNQQKADSNDRAKERRTMYTLIIIAILTVVCTFMFNVIFVSIFHKLI